MSQHHLCVSYPQKENLRLGEGVLTKVAQHTGRGAKKSDPELLTITPWLLSECRATADGKVPSRFMCNGVILTDHIMYTLQSSAQE